MKNETILYIWNALAHLHLFCELKTNSKYGHNKSYYIKHADITIGLYIIPLIIVVKGQYEHYISEIFSHGHMRMIIGIPLNHKN